MNHPFTDSRQTLETIRHQHEELLRQADKQGEVDFKLVQTFLESLTKSGATIENAEDRSSLYELIRYWSSFINNRTGEFPVVQLQPFNASLIHSRSTHLLKFFRQITTAVLILALIIGGIIISIVVGSSKELGGLNLVEYCASLHYDDIGRVAKTAVDWNCTRQSSLKVDMTQACNWQYARNNLVARNTTANDLGSWLCYDDQHVIGGLANLNGYCMLLNYDKVGPVGSDWVCTRQPSLKIDMTQACSWQYHGWFVQARNSSDDPFRWRCYGLVL